MSGASNQAQRAGIRESTGNGNTAGSTTSSTHPYIPRLDPNDDEIVKLLQGQKIAKKALKYKILKNIFQSKAALSAYMEALTVGAATEFSNVDFGNTTPAMKAIGQCTSEMLGQLLCNVRNAIRTILPTSQNFNGLSAPLQTIVRELWVVYDNARVQAATELQSSFSSQFLTITGPERDRRYLDGGYTPTTPGHEICLVCTHGYCDEPDSNRTVARDNQQLRAGWTLQIAADQAAWDRNEEVTNVRGTVMTQGRKRNEPKYKSLIIHCHCREFGCTTSAGDVPESMCPIKCLDNNGNRFLIDPVTGQCECPICSCNDCPRFFTPSAHQLYRAHRMLAANGGQASTSNPGPTRHRPPPSVVGNYHQTAESFGAIINRHTHSAVNGALLAARDNIQAGIPTASLDMGVVNEHIGVFTGREIAETMHGDSAFFPMLTSLAAAAGPPSTFTNLPNNNALYNARGIASSSRQHRTSNNRLNPITASNNSTLGGGGGARSSALLFPPGVRTSASASATSQSTSNVNTSFVASASAMGASTTGASHGSNPAMLAAMERQQMGQAIQASLAQSQGTKRPVAEPAITDTSGDGDTLSIDPRKMPAALVTAKKKAVPANNALLRTINNTLHDHQNSRPSSGPISMPSALDSVDTSFFTTSASQNQPPNSPIASIQRNPMAAIMHAGDSDDEAGVAAPPNNQVDAATLQAIHASEMVDRALNRSFDESEAGASVINVDTGEDEEIETEGAEVACRRANMILDQPEKATHLTHMFLNRAARNNQTVDSPAVNAMLDRFINNGNGNGN